jgi:hypothetical protein
MTSLIAFKYCTFYQSLWFHLNFYRTFIFRKYVNKKVTQGVRVVGYKNSLKYKSLDEFHEIFYEKSWLMLSRFCAHNKNISKTDRYRQGSIFEQLLAKTYVHVCVQKRQLSFIDDW